MLWVRIIGGVLMGAGAGIFGYYLIDFTQWGPVGMGSGYVYSIRPFLAGALALIVVGLLVYREGCKRAD